MVEPDPLSPVFETELQLDAYALSTAIYAERADGKILLLERAEGSAMAGFYFLPGGLVDPGETPFQTAARELQEESGLVFREPPRLVGCYPLFVYGRQFMNLTFRGAVTGEVKTSVEHTAHRWVTPQEWASSFTDAVAAEGADKNSHVASLVREIHTDAQRYLSVIESTT